MHVQERLHKCLSVCVEGAENWWTGNNESTQGRWRGWQTHSLLSHTPIRTHKCLATVHWYSTILALICVLFSCPHTLPSPSHLSFLLPLRLLSFPILTSPPSPVSSHQSISLYGIIFLSYLVPARSLPKSTLLFFFHPLLSLVSDLLSAILILWYCFVSDVLLCPYEMHFKDAACWRPSLISLPNQRSFFFIKQRFIITVTPLRCFMLIFGSDFV